MKHTTQHNPRKTSHSPLVSVIMPVYNANGYLGEAISSIIKQTYRNIELVIVDDGSTDDSWTIIQQYQIHYPDTIRAFKLRKNRGESYAANYAYKKSRGDFIARMDADDISHPTRIEKQVAYMQKHKETIVLGSNVRVVDRDGKRIGKKVAPYTHKDIYEALAFINPMNHPTVMFRSSLLPKNKPLYTSEYESTVDYHTYFKILDRGKFANLPEQLVSYRVHSSNKSLDNMKEKFWTNAALRLRAVHDYNYKAPFLMYLGIAVQAMMVLALPEVVLREVFFYIRGLKKLHIPALRFPIGAIKHTMKQYALSR